MSPSFEYISKDNSDKSFIINHASLFANLSSLEKKLILEKSEVIDYKKGSIIYKQFDPPDAFYCVISGKVRISDTVGGEKELLELLHCGKYFGIISLLTGELHSVNAEAVNDSKVLRINKEDFHTVLKMVPDLAIDLSRILSRRLSKKYAHGKRVFESSIISVIGTARGGRGALYAENLSISLKKETGRSIILIKILSGVDQAVPQALNLLQVNFNAGSIIKDAIVKDADSGINILNITCNNLNDGVCSGNINFLLSFLASDFHFIILDISDLINTDIFGILDQSDVIHLITDYDTRSMQETKVLISELSQRIKYPHDRIKVIVNADIISKIFSVEEVSKLLDFKIYAMLPSYLGKAIKITLEEPHCEYTKAVRRIAREVGDVRIGLALSGGAAFGLAQIGVIKVLESEDIPIDAITGSSIGALIGALWACGLNSDELKKIVSELNSKKKVLGLLFEPHFPRLSFSKGRRLKKFLEKHIGKKTFQDTWLPLKIVTCNLTRRQEFIYDSGNIVDAVMASIAIPGLFTPIKTDGNLVVDGGIINPIPISVLAKMGIKKVIAVNVFPSPQDIGLSIEFKSRRMEEEKRQAEKKGFFAKIKHNLGISFNKILFPNILDIIVNSIQMLEFVIAEQDCRRANIVIRPVGVGVDWIEFFKADELIKIGEEETRKSLAALKSLISE
jgi:predicted acylesterase/phospholipase RssA/CRP-like cAMP-binding protein